MGCHLIIKIIFFAEFVCYLFFFENDKERQLFYVFVY